MKETLQNFLTTGSLGTIEFGTRRKEIAMILGTTDSVIPRTRKDPRPAVLKYGQVEFYFNESDELYGIMIQLVTGPLESHGLEFDFEWINDGTSEDDISDKLDNLNVKFKTDNKFDSTYVTTETGVTFYLSERLDKVGKFVNSV